MPQIMVPSAGSERPAFRPAALNLSNSPVSAASPPSGEPRRWLSARVESFFPGGFGGTMFVSNKKLMLFGMIALLAMMGAAPINASSAIMPRSMSFLLDTNMVFLRILRERKTQREPRAAGSRCRRAGRLR